jgi:hypothetical protein
MKCRIDSHDIAPYLFETKEKYLIQITIFKFLDATWLEFWQNPFIQTVAVPVLPLSCKGKGKGKAVPLQT